VVITIKADADGIDNLVQKQSGKDATKNSNTKQQQG
jgi:hypothetical protein